jgi:tight adherence protein B
MTPAPPTATGRSDRRSQAVAGTVATLAVVGVAGAGFGPHGGVLAGLAVAVAVAGRRGVRRARDRADEEHARAAAEDVLAAFADELDAGHPPAQALRSAVAGVLDDRRRRAADRTAAAALRVPLALDQLPALLAAGSYDPAAVLRACDAPALRQLGVGWQVSHRTGIRLAPVASKLAATVRADSDRRRELRASLAGARSSARLLAGLPLAGIALGFLVGARPDQVLSTTDLGLACLVTGVALDLVGLRWTNRIAAAAVATRAEPVPSDGARRGKRTAQLVADLPVALDLTAACLAAGTPPDVAQHAVGSALGPPLGPALTAVALRTGRGEPPGEAFTELVESGRRRRFHGLGVGLGSGFGFRAGRDGAGPSGTATTAVVGVSRAFARSGDSGARVAATLERIADRLRANTHADTVEAVRRAGVVAVLPLGLCFLPAFGLLGVVPVVLGTADGLLGQILPAADFP